MIIKNLLYKKEDIIANYKYNQYILIEAIIIKNEFLLTLFGQIF